MTSLAGKVAVVTGASRGVGRAVAIELAELGATVVLTARTVDPRPDVAGTLAETAAAIEKAGGSCTTIAADLLVPEDVVRLASTVLSEHGRVDVLVNNAAYIGDAVFRPFWDMTGHEWRSMLDVNVNAAFDLMKAFAPSMREQGGGLIINVSSSRGTPRPPGSVSGGANMGAAYPTSKAALTQMTAYLGAELLPAGIVVVALDPGFTRSESSEVLGERYGVDLTRAHGPDVPARAAGWLATTDSVKDFAGQLVVAKELVD